MKIYEYFFSIFRIKNAQNLIVERKKVFHDFGRIHLTGCQKIDSMFYKEEENGFG